MYLLDTNVVSELRRQRPHGAVVAWLRPLDQRDLFISAVTLGELQAGIEVTRERDATKATEIEAWVDRVSETWNILPMDDVSHVGQAHAPAIRRSNRGRDDRRHGARAWPARRDAKRQRLQAFWS
jgi:predicted nucleic acid-binding protein